MIIPDSAIDEAAGIPAAADTQAQDKQVTVECFDNFVPPFVEATLEQLYGNLFSTLAHRRVYGDARNMNTFIVRSGVDIIAIWLFERRGRTVRVLNEGLEIRDSEVNRFAHFIFDRYPATGVIVFHAVQSRLDKLALPYQRHNCLEDMVLKLPASSTDYLAQMGKSTRSYIHRYMNKLRRDHPSVRFVLMEAHEVDERQIQRIIDLNRARMAHKGKVSINDATLAEQITHLAMDCGMIGMLTIEGRIVAGTINYRVRDNYFLEVIAHDPTLNEYRIGTLCCYLTVCECIARGGDEYHFLWGQDEYKTRLLGKKRDLDDLVVYRSRARQFMHAGTALGHVADDWSRRAHLWARQARQGEGPVAALVQVTSDVLRKLRSA